MAQTPPVEPTTEPDAPPEGLPCPECGEVIPPRGKMGAPVALGMHRKKEHGVQGRSAQAKKAKKTERPARGLAVVREVRDELGAGKGAPSKDSLTKAFGRLYGYGMLLTVDGMVDGDPRVRDEADRARLVDVLAPSPDEATATMAPLARAFAASGLNKRYGHALVENSDVAECLYAIGQQVRRLTAYRRERAALVAGQAAGTVAVFPAGAPLEDRPTASDTSQSGGAPAGAPRVPAQGIVVTADMVAQLRNGDAQ